MNIYTGKAIDIPCTRVFGAGGNLYLHRARVYASTEYSQHYRVAWALATDGATVGFFYPLDDSLDHPQTVGALSTLRGIAAHAFHLSQSREHRTPADAESARYHTLLAWVTALAEQGQLDKPMVDAFNP